MTAPARCRYCERRHSVRYLCDPVMKILVAMHADAESYNMSVDFDDPTIGSVADTLGFGGPGDTLMIQLVVKSLIIEALGVWRPALVITGRAPGGQTLPQYIYAGDDEDIRRAAALFRHRGEAAIEAAANARSRGL